MLTLLELLPVNIIQLLSLFVSIIAILMLRGEQRYAGLILAFIVQAMAVLFNFLEELRWVNFMVTPAMSLAVGPGFYLAVRVLVRTDAPLHQRDAVHFLPALVALPFSTTVGWVLAFGAVSQLIYLHLSFALLLRYQRAVAERRSDPEHFQLRWLMRIFFALIMLIIVELIRANLQPFLPFAMRNHWYFIDQLALLAVITGLLVGIVRQPAVFEGMHEYEASEQEPTEQLRDREHAESLFAELDQLVRQQRLYTKPRLALQDLAEQTGLHSRDISWAINSGGGSSFAEYINRLRIENVVKQACSTPKRTLLTIAMDAGFSSKSSFNAVFKKHTGMSPSRYLKSLES